MRTGLSPRRLWIEVGLTVAVVALVMVACTAVGTQPISLRAAIGLDGRQASDLDRQIWLQIRVPRVVTAAVVGAALAGAGVVFQVLLRNPLADPYILGVSSGAGMGAMLAVIAGLNWTVWGRTPIAVCAFAGALTTGALVWFLSGRSQGGQNTRLLLSGVVVNAFFSAVILFLTSMARADQLSATVFWLMGNICEEEFLVTWITSGLVLAGVVGLFLLSPQLNALSFGDEQARSMGIEVRKVRAWAFALASLVTAVAVSLSGLIGFVGLVIPHALRLLVGADHRRLIPFSVLVGAGFLVVADTVARIVVAPAQMPVGILTAIIGGPVFLVMLARCRKDSGLLG